MKIALCSKGTFSLEIGSTKNRIELAESLQKLGWEVTMVDNKLLGISFDEKLSPTGYSLALKTFLIANSYKFNVVLYEYDTLPFDRSLFNKSTLFVARPAILGYRIPLAKFKYNLKTKVSNSYKWIINWFSGTNKDVNIIYKKFDYCLNQADIIQVQNRKDQDLLINRGFKKDKIIVIPNGISSDRINLFNNIEKKFQEPFTLAFVGTFDFRKGAMDFPFIFSRLKKRYSNLQLKLLGTCGLFKTSSEVLNFFPKRYHSDIEVIPKFKANELSGHLKSCHIGIFPSYLESFGFGALEMMCAGLPVVGYDSPGPSDFLLTNLIVRTGDRLGIIQKIIILIEDETLLKQMSQQARDVVINHYSWEDIGIKVDKNYKYYLRKLRNKNIAL